jgi:hypothetical protein
MSRDQRRALRLLAGSPLGVTEAIMLAHGFTNEMLVDLVHEGLATATPETVHAGKRPIEVVRVPINDARRLALAWACQLRQEARHADSKAAGHPS